MRLLRADTRNGIRLDVFDDIDTTPPYAILSHRWGPDEVLFADLVSDGPKTGDRFKKLLGCCKRALRDGYAYVWIDTCCIDQKSSAELSESINSMYLWYSRSAICYAYLQDVTTSADPDSSESSFRKSVWFTRGWTLQELIAPSNVLFLTQSWRSIGYKADLAGTIQEITRIDYGVLCGLALVQDTSVAERMSWASNRKTTKVEDRAYSLLGIFGVNMPAIYGEGSKAFERLQHEIMNQSTDYSILVWRQDRSDTNLAPSPVLASSPDAFSESSGVIVIPDSHFAKVWGYRGNVGAIKRTLVGISLEVPLTKLHGYSNVVVAVIPCKKPDSLPSPNNYSTVGIVLEVEPQRRCMRKTGRYTWRGPVVQKYPNGDERPF